MTTPNDLTALAEACERAAYWALHSMTCPPDAPCPQCKQIEDAAKQVGQFAAALRAGRVTVARDEAP